ncbi:hypothetical protein E2C01_058615 [Portunus trituberculatus]|uniref:Uncharacterized protein n=1 Tax=Portunus trituberculatus TaxID=210409 RepID=A0A5B7H5W8_PORTR|nr:hypothetical protein [Portunus trituberculatus]
MGGAVLPGVVTGGRCAGREEEHPPPLATQEEDHHAVHATLNTRPTVTPTSLTLPPCDLGREEQGAAPRHLPASFIRLKLSGGERVTSQPASPTHPPSYQNYHSH